MSSLVRRVSKPCRAGRWRRARALKPKWISKIGRTNDAWREEQRITTDRTLLASVLFLLIAGTGCTVKTEEYVRPDQITDFKTLYSENCAGCHGDDGRLGAAQALNDPLFQHLAPKDFVRNAVANGIPGHMMPGAAKSAGGFLTDKQLNILVDGMQQNWGHPGDFGNAPQL